MKTFIKISAFLIVFAAGIFAQDAVWQVSGTIPRGIYGGEAVVVDSLIYVFGGYSDSLQRVTDYIYVFNPANNTWTLKNKMKKRRRDMIAYKFGSSIYYAGGESHELFRANGLLEKYDYLTNSVSVVDSNKRFNRIRGTGLIKDSVLYVAGGAVYNPPQGFNPYLFEYNIPAKKMTYNSSNYFQFRFPEEQMLARVGNYLYIMGGYFNTVSRDIYRYNISKHWLVQSPFELITTRSAGRSVVTNDSSQVIVLGGYNESSFELSSVEVYDFTDTTTVVFRNTSPMNYKRKYFMTAYVNGYLYVFGGIGAGGRPVLEIERMQIVTNVNDEQKGIPSSFNLMQNYPNPFNGTTIIKYSVPSRNYISIKVYDILGKEVAELVNNEMEAGNHSVQFNTGGLSSGIYYYRLSSGNFSYTRKMILLK